MLVTASTLASTAGCARTVARLDGEFAVPPGPARTQCEKERWLVLAPTRYGRVPEGSDKAIDLDDGAGVYPVGSKEATSITGLKGAVESPIIDRKIEETSGYDRDRIIAASLGGVGVIAMAVGSILFVNGFDTKTVPRENEIGEDTVNDNDATQIAIGAGTVGAGLIIGIIGLVINPDHADRTRAEASRFAFQPDQDSPEAVRKLVNDHNRQVRQQCKALGTDVPLGSAPAEAEETPDSPWSSGAPLRDPDGASEAQGDDGEASGGEGDPTADESGD